MSYEEKRVKLRQFGVQVTLFAAGHEPRYAIDWCFDLDAGWLPEADEGDDWVIFTRESALFLDCRS